MVVYSQFKIIQNKLSPPFEPFPSGNPILPPFHFRKPDTHQTQNLSQILHLVTSLLPFKAHQPSMNSKPSPSMSNGWGFRFSHLFPSFAIKNEKKNPPFQPHHFITISIIWGTLIRSKESKKLRQPPGHGSQL